MRRRWLCAAIWLAILPAEIAHAIYTRPAPDFRIANPEVWRIAATSARSDDIRFINGDVTHCTLKGIITAYFQAPQIHVADVLNGERKVGGGVIETDALVDLKRQAAALGANRIVVRDLNSEGTMTMGRGALVDRKWEGSKIVAEAQRC